MNNKENKWLSNIYKDIFNVELDELIHSAFAEIREQNNHSVQLSKDDLLSLIDLALLTNDKEWFMELTGKLDKSLVNTR